MAEESGFTSQKNAEQIATHESDFIHGIMGIVVSEPIPAIAYKFTEMADESIARLKEGIQEMILKEDNQDQLYLLQGILSNRNDITLETLLKCHRVQLEILVAIKTGVAGFLQHGHSVSLVDLAEIFLNLKCRNPNCGSELPVDECECKFCSRKDGFCNMCMCLVCSKFDTASNTCGWIGCDSCSHWCHPFAKPSNNQDKSLVFILDMFSREELENKIDVVDALAGKLMKRFNYSVSAMKTTFHHLSGVQALEVEIGELKGRLTEVINNSDALCKRISLEGPESLQSTIKPFAMAASAGDLGTSYNLPTSVIAHTRQPPKDNQF